MLGGLAAFIGLSSAGAGLRWAWQAALPGFVNTLRVHTGAPALPFWFHPSLSSMTVAYALGLTLLGAVVAGVMPGLKVTRGLQARLGAATAGGGGSSFGAIWTVVIGAQIAVTVSLSFAAFPVLRDMVRLRAIDLGFSGREYVTASLGIEYETAGRVSSDSAQFAARYRVVHQELVRRLAADPVVAGVTFGDRLPGMYHPQRLIEVDKGGTRPRDPHSSPPGYLVGPAHVDPRMFDLFDIRIIAGRAFHAADVGSAHGVVIVNQSFADRVLGGSNPLGRRVRYIDLDAGERSADLRPGPWYEIVGVVRDVGNVSEWYQAGFYHPVSLHTGFPPSLIAVHVKGSAQAFAPRMREIAAAVDPTLRLHNTLSMDKLKSADLKLLGFWFRLILMVSSTALLLSLAGIYAVMAFTVARRTREIGIRIALGASTRRVLLGIFRRPLTQIALGIICGAVLVALQLLGITEATLSARQAALIAAYATIMLVVCMLACIVPTRRALRIEPTEALREE